MTNEMLLRCLSLLNCQQVTPLSDRLWISKRPVCGRTSMKWMRHGSKFPPASSIASAPDGSQRSEKCLWLFQDFSSVGCALTWLQRSYCVVPNEIKASQRPFLDWCASFPKAQSLDWKMFFWCRWARIAPPPKIRMFLCHPSNGKISFQSQNTDTTSNCDVTIA